MTAPVHPLGLTDNPEWAKVEKRRHELRMAERARRPQEPVASFPLWPFVAVMAAVAVGVAYVSFFMGFGLAMGRGLS